MRSVDLPQVYPHQPGACFSLIVVQMASPNPSTPYTASPSYRPQLGIFEALERLVNFDLSKHDILLMSRLGAVGVGKILDLFQNEGRSAVDQLVGSLEGHSENTLGSMIDVAASKCSLSLAHRRGRVSCQVLFEHCHHCWRRIASLWGNARE